MTVISMKYVMRINVNAFLISLETKMDYVYLVRLIQYNSKLKIVSYQKDIKLQVEYNFTL